MAKEVNYTLPKNTSWSARWPQWIGFVTAIWSLLYGLLGLYWMLGGNGFPFGPGDPNGAQESVLEGLRVETGAPVIAVLGLIGVLLALIMSFRWGGKVVRIPLLTIAILLAAALLIIIPDRRVLMAVAYAPIFLIGAPFHWPPVSFSKAIPWPVINQAILMVGGALWAATAVTYNRSIRGACTHCGRLSTQSEEISKQKALYWGKWAVAFAAMIPIVYAATRWIWALGIPLGISEQMLREGQASGMWLAGASLASVSIVGSILTLGLVQRWGEIFPRWMIGLAGKRVPPRLAIIPATIVALVVTSAGLEYVRIVATRASFIESWTTMGPELLWPFWGVALGAATLAYAYRRRERCKYCS
ncbi:hypothetical protein KDA_71040 [Dictyobacter alpinus]|uniref:Uncharacterized protein n=1 Tax=Dictyobacter alpinus TaxID=2014873 RepID=A0A402BJV6_9CHLR|nr:hypothetical protein [Dictyobacter alpinus]GCE31620.1 hypothetical protein KDA_71040 [Dictyobacter alpinus]